MTFYLMEAVKQRYIEAIGGQKGNEMKIKQVEELVGITSKNIRFYEDQGLVNPERAENGYREYHQKEVECLKKIKLLRKFGVPIEEIKQVISNKIPLETCIEKQVLTFETEKTNLEKMQVLAGHILSQAPTIHNLDCDHWLEEVEKMEKEGIDFVDVNKIDIHMKKKAGALAGGIIVIALLLIPIFLMIWACSMDPEIPTLFLVLFIGGPAISIVGIIVALINRLKEIDGGEEDEASKY